MASLHHPPAYKTVCNTHSKSSTSSKLPMCHWESGSHELLCHTSKHNHTEHPSSATKQTIYIYIYIYIYICHWFVSSSLINGEVSCIVPLTFSASDTMEKWWHFAVLPTSLKWTLPSCSLVNQHESLRVLRSQLWIPSLMCSQIWLRPLVNDNKPAYLTKVRGKKP
jgi:hypothetical protein